MGLLSLFGWLGIGIASFNDKCNREQRNYEIAKKHGCKTYQDSKNRERFTDTGAKVPKYYHMQQDQQFYDSRDYRKYVARSEGVFDTYKFIYRKSKVEYPLLSYEEWVQEKWDGFPLANIYYPQFFDSSNKMNMQVRMAITEKKRQQNLIHEYDLMLEKIDLEMFDHIRHLVNLNIIPRYRHNYFVHNKEYIRKNGTTVDFCDRLDRIARLRFRKNHTKQDFIFIFGEEK